MAPIKKSFIILRNLFPFLIALFIALISLSIVIFYSYHLSKQYTINTSQEIISKLDNLFISAQTLSSTAIPLMDINCETAQPILKDIMKLSPNFQSIELIKNHKLYCTSNTDANNQQIIKHDLDYSQISNLPTTSLVFYDTVFFINDPKSITNHRSIVITVTPDTLRNILKPKIATQIINLKMSNRVLNYEGILKHSPFIFQPIKEDSPNGFPYTIKVGFVAPNTVDVLLSYHSIEVLIIILLVIFSYIGSRWFINNISGTYFEFGSAIQNGEIKAYVQPVYHAESNTLTGVEVLARWEHPTLGMVMPDTFIPVAEKTGLIIPMTQYLIKEVAQGLAPYKKKLNKHFHVGFNISRPHCQSLQLVDDCKGFYKYIGSDQITLIIEITERELIEVTDITKELFKQLHQLDIKIALDDFGIGNSNLAYLRDFAIDYLKIDKSFVSRIGTDALSINILDSIIEIAHNCHLESCAEGLETELQVEYLKTKRVNFLQGYFFSKPIPLQDFIKSTAFQKIIT